MTAGRPKIELEQDQKDKICNLAATEGMTMSKIAKKMGHDSSTIWENIWRDDKFFQDFMRATDCRSILWHDEMHDEARDKDNDNNVDKNGIGRDSSAVVKRSQLIVDTIWKDFQQAHFALASTRLATKSKDYDISAHMLSVLELLKNGRITVDVADKIMGVINKACQIKETIDFLPRLKALEAASNINNT